MSGCNRHSDSHNANVQKISIIIVENRPLKVASVTIKHYIAYIHKIDYNIPGASLLNRQPVPAVDLKSNRSGL